MRKLLLVPLLAALAGCGADVESTEMADVSGIITLKGQPLADADVYFTTGKFEGYGRTDEKGHYTLTRGAPVGECKVYITKVETAAATDGIDLGIDGMDEEQMRAMAEGQGGGAAAAAKKEPLIPPEFSDPEKTKLKITIPPEGTDKADFKL